jgi:hypothetical protein
MRCSVVLWLLVLAPAVAGAQADGSAKHAGPEKGKPRSGWAALPVATYAPETELGLGAFGTHFFRPESSATTSRPSSVSVVAIYTLREQLIVELIPELYWDAQRWHLWSRADYRFYPNALWAIGAGSPESSKESFTERRARGQVTLDTSLYGALRLGAKAEILYMQLEGVEAGGLLDGRALPGARGGASVGAGPALFWDTRDHLLVPHRGELYQLTAMGFGAPIGSEYDFASLVLDLRRYLPVTSTHTLALQLYSELLVGEVPFYKLALLGGQNLLRGHFEGRFRDKSLLALQAEYRLPLFWRFSGVVHSALGQVAEAPTALVRNAPEWAVGGGLRFVLNTDERLNLRADVGLGREAVGIYVSVGEAY